MPPQNQQKEFYDTLGTFEQGVNSYLPPLLLPKNQLSTALNTTVRGDYVTQRSLFRKVYLDPVSQGILNTAISKGSFQALSYFKPDFGPEGIAVVMGGQLISIFPDPNVNTARAVTINSWVSAAWVNGNMYAQGAFASVVINGVATDFQVATTAYAGSPSTISPQFDPANWKQQNLPNGENWVWQSEMFLVWNDGASNPIFYNVDSGTAIRSTFGVPLPQATNFNGAQPAMNAPGTATTLLVDTTANMSVGQTLTFLNFGQATVLAKNGDGVHVDVNNINVRVGTVMPDDGGVNWTNVGSSQLPPGRMGTYGMGRNWISGTDGNTFFASDGAGGSSGTQALDFRDAPLNITENAFLAGGGAFLVPGSSNIVNITAMRFVANLDQSLGQGPLQVFTRTQAFSCQTPVDRLTWQDVSNPILTMSIIGYGATGQDSTINVNSDLLFRSLIGFSSQILARRDFDTWGNVPISIEVSSITDDDNQTLLNWGSAILFDNRVLWTAKPTQTTQGVVHKVIVPLNLDPVSSLRGKQPSVYDSLRWTGLNVFKLVVGSFANRERAFAVCWDNVGQSVDLYEILTTSSTSIMDNDIVRVVWSFNSASLFRESKHVFKRLVDGEIYVDELKGQVDFQVWWKPDQYPCFLPWLSWTECATQPLTTQSPSFRPRMGLGPPPTDLCDPSTNRQLILGYTFDMRFIITGAVRFLGGKFKAVAQDEPEFAVPNCVDYALAAALKAQVAANTPTPPVPPPSPGSATVVVDKDENIIVDSSGNVLLG